MSKIETFNYYESADGVYGVKISDRDMQHIYELCIKSSPYETGGILLGRYSDDQKWAEVMVVTGAPAGSRHDLHSFTRSGKGIVSLLKESWKSHQYYLGEWHYHPNASPQPSGLDLKTMFKLSETERLHCPEPVLLIIGGGPLVWNQYVGVCIRGNVIELDNSTIK